MQRGGQRVEDISERAAAAALLQSRVVVDADPGQPRELLAPQTRDPSPRGLVGQPSVLRAQQGTASMFPKVFPKPMKTALEVSSEGRFTW